MPGLRGVLRGCSSSLRTGSATRRSLVPVRQLPRASACLLSMAPSAQRLHRNCSTTAPPKPSLADKIATLAPGTLASAAVMGAGFVAADKIGKAMLVAQGLPEAASPLSGVPVAIVLGLVLNNAASLPASLKPGLKFCTTTLLRAGIVCVGIKLSMFDVAKLGVAGVPVVVSAVSAGLVFTTWFSNKLDLPPRIGLLTAAGTSICGVTAIVSLAPAIKATEKEIAFSVANVVAFGLCGMLFYPYLAHALLPTSEQIGLFLGTAIHDTSQVMGAALTYKEVFNDELVLKVAAVTKLSRNLFLAAVIPGLTWVHARSAGGLGSAGGKGAAKLPLSTLFPSFIGGFLAMALLRTAGDAGLGDGLAFGVLDAAQWKTLTSYVGGDVGSYLLGTAMSAVGLGTSLSVFQGVGFKPVLLGFAGAVVVGSTGFTMAYLLGPYLALESPEKTNKLKKEG